MAGWSGTFASNANTPGRARHTNWRRHRVPAAKLRPTARRLLVECAVADDLDLRRQLKREIAEALAENGNGYVRQDWLPEADFIVSRVERSAFFAEAVAAAEFTTRDGNSMIEARRPLNLSGVEERYADYDKAIGPGGEKAWNAHQCATDVPWLIAQIRELEAAVAAAEVRVAGEAFSDAEACCVVLASEYMEIGDDGEVVTTPQARAALEAAKRVKRLAARSVPGTEKP